MLGKLMKYDWKSVSKVETLIACVVGGYSLVVAVMMQTPVYSGLITGTDISDSLRAFAAISGVLGIIGLFILMAGAGFVGNIYLGVRFFKSMYDDEGYLTHTLPATSKDILTSKILTGVLWSMIISLVILISGGMIATSGVILGFRSGLDMEQIEAYFRDAVDLFGDMLEMFKASLAHGIIISVIRFFAEPFIMIAHIFGALTIGQTFKKNRGLMGVVLYFAITWGTSFVMTIVRGISQAFLITRTFSLDEAGTGSFLNLNMFLTVDLELIVRLIVAIVLVIISHRIITTKLNLI